MVAVRDGLDARVPVLLAQVDAVSPQRRIMLRLRLHVLHPVHHLVVELRQVVAVLEALNILLGKLVRVLECVGVVDVYVRVVVVNDYDATAVG